MLFLGLTQGFNKWEVHQLLMKDESIMPLLPNTETFQHFEQVERFLGTYKSIYMKPIHGSFGRNIHQLFYSQAEIATTVVIAKMKKIN